MEPSGYLNKFQVGDREGYWEDVVLEIIVGGDSIFAILSAKDHHGRRAENHET